MEQEAHHADLAAGKPAGIAQPRAAAALGALALTAVEADARAWTLEEAAVPCKGATVRTIGEALPPMEALANLKHNLADLVPIQLPGHSRWIAGRQNVPDRLGNLDMQGGLQCPTLGAGIRLSASGPRTASKDVTVTSS